MKARPDEFYIGYLPKAAEHLGRAIFHVVFAVIFLAIVLALLLVLAQQPFADSTFEFLQYRDHQGTLVKSPYPALLTTDDFYLLVGPGKHGAADLVRGLSPSFVHLSGSLIRRGDEWMLEIVPGSIRQAAGSPRAVQITDLETVTLAGEIVDSKCYFGVMNPGNGKVHRDCAVRCISGGIPPAFVVKDASGATRSLLLTGVQSREVLDFVAEPVIIHGRLQRLESELILAIEKRGNKPAIDRH
jgi:hypothetical protein